MNLTKQERMYYEYVLLEQAKSMNRGLLIAFVCLAGFCMIFVVAGFSEGSSYGVILTATGIFCILFFGILFYWKCGTYRHMYKDLQKGNYKVKRTTLVQPVKKKRITWVNGHRRVSYSYFFDCVGIEETVQPLSMDLWNVARPNMPVTIVNFQSMHIISYGIVFDRAFDQKVLEWDRKRNR